MLVYCWSALPGELTLFPAWLSPPHLTPEWEGRGGSAYSRCQMPLYVYIAPLCSVTELQYIDTRLNST